MSSALSAFHWKGSPSEIGAALGRTQTPPKPISFSNKSKHPLRGTEAQAIGSKSRAPTANINTEPHRIVRTQKAKI